MIDLPAERCPSKQQATDAAAAKRIALCGGGATARRQSQTPDVTYERGKAVSSTVAPVARLWQFHMRKAVRL